MGIREGLSEEVTLSRDPRAGEVRAEGTEAWSPETTLGLKDTPWARVVRVEDGH